MDILSHGLWGATVLRPFRKGEDKRKFLLWAMLAGMAPDILGSGAAFIYLLMIGEFWGEGTWQFLPQWTRELYHFHHSLLSVVVYWAILFIVVREYDILILPYLFHVLLDGVTHDTNLLNRLFYPAVFDYGIHGLNWWEHWWIMGLNVVGLLLVNAFFFLRKKSGSQAPGRVAS